MKIKVRNQVTGREYECREDDFIRAKRKGAALVRIGVVEPEKEVKPSFLTEEIENVEEEKEEEVMPGSEERPATKRKRKPRKKAGGEE